MLCFIHFVVMDHKIVLHAFHWTTGKLGSICLLNFKSKTTALDTILSYNIKSIYEKILRNVLKFIILNMLS